MVGIGLIDRLGPEILEKLPTSTIIKVRCPHSAYKSNGKSVYLPEVLACAVSSRFRDLCKGTSKRNFTADEVLDGSADIFMRDLINGSFYTQMCLFQQWLYGSDISKDKTLCCDRWYFGQNIGSPMYQNDAMRLLRSSVRPAPAGIKIITRDSIGYKDISLIWDQADFTPDEELGYDDSQCGEVYWGNKQMLRFFLDISAFIGTKDDEVSGLIAEGGPCAIQIAKLIDAAARSGGFESAPWKLKNLQRYLVDDCLSGASVEKTVAPEASGVVPSTVPTTAKINLKRKSPSEEYGRG